MVPRSKKGEVARSLAGSIGPVYREWIVNGHINDPTHSEVQIPNCVNTKRTINIGTQSICKLQIGVVIEAESSSGRYTKWRRHILRL